ncbi:TetR/AcrR family transcriptional regulator [Clostridium guangxiense]|uniref:TetR/AcrR family transcriptional regulator n=1 Tax=Clostridium guangxiense TaxID=1662055 RepID=UPI001E42C18C|nr:TetR/AcrR family transcriptional regulator [Clostridium guangxiense]MCD2348205.1 TetR/AcrR family transcriptional regulator [Clostridium guangxiense]
MVRKASENREQQILDAAIKIFSEKGYNAATTSEISKEAGIAEGTLFRYFKNKKTLLAKIVILSSKTIGKNIIARRLGKLIEKNKDKDLKEILKLIMLDRIDLLEKNKELFKIVFTEIQYQDDLKEAFKENIILVGKDILFDYIDKSKLKDLFKDVDPMVVGRTMIASVFAYVVQSTVFPELITISKEQQVDEMVEVFLNGIVRKGDEGNEK